MASAAGSPGTLLAEIELRHFSQTLSLLRIYNVYRILVGLVLLLIHTQDWLRTDLGRAAPSLFL